MRSLKAAAFEVLAILFAVILGVGLVAASGVLNAQATYYGKTCDVSPCK